MSDDTKRIATTEKMSCPSCGYRAMPQLTGLPFTQESTVGRVILTDTAGDLMCPKCKTSMISSKAP